MAAKREAQATGWKRINFFKGFLTTEHDWNDAEGYHLEKRKLHNRLCHAPGVVPGHAGELRVSARAREDLSLEIQPGYAVDGRGHDLFLSEPVIRAIALEEYKLPQTLYVVLRYVEELTDFIAYKENLEYKGHRRVLESCRVEISQTAPDLKEEVELARILVEKAATRIRDARDPQDPRANEIDLRWVPRAGVAGSFLDGTMKMRMASTFASLRKGLFRLARDGRVMTAHDALAAVLSASMLNATDDLDLWNVFEVMGLVVEMESEICADVEANHPAIAQRSQFADFRKHVEILKGLLRERRCTAEALQNLTGYQQKAGELVNAILDDPLPQLLEEEVPLAAPTPKREGMNLEAVKSLSGIDLPDELEIDDRTWVMVDRIDVMNKESEEEHQLGIHDAKDSYRSRQKLKYPDGTVVEDVGRAHVGGYTEYRVQNLKAGQDLLVVRRMDYVYGDYELEFFVDRKSAGVCSCKGTDRVNRWRNWPYLISGDLITKDKVTIRQSAATGGRDVNLFRLWMYQPK